MLPDDENEMAVEEEPVLTTAPQPRTISPCHRSLDEEPDEVNANVLSRSIAGLMDEIELQRVVSEVPSIRPTELKDKEKGSLAEECLGLVEKSDAVELQSFIADAQRKYFETNKRMDEPGTYREKLAHWNEQFYYPCSTA